jgi:hypothetical protein
VSVFAEEAALGERGGAGAAGEAGGVEVPVGDAQHLAAALAAARAAHHLACTQHTHTSNMYIKVYVKSWAIKISMPLISKGLQDKS